MPITILIKPHPKNKLKTYFLETFLYKVDIIMHIIHCFMVHRYTFIYEAKINELFLKESQISSPKGLRNIHILKEKLLKNLQINI